MYFLQKRVWFKNGDFDFQADPDSLQTNVFRQIIVCKSGKLTITIGLKYLVTSIYIIKPDWLFLGTNLIVVLQKGMVNAGN